MKIKRMLLMAAVVLMAVAASHLLVTALASAQPSSVVPPAREEIDLRSVEQLLPTDVMSVTFPGGDWPWYAQEEIFVHPEPPIGGHPTDLCAEVVNHDPTAPYTVVLEFDVANFGIGVPFQPVGHVELMVPAGDHARGCVVWVPPEPGHWCIQAVIHRGEPYPPEISQRNIDVWEPLVPGESHELVFPVGPFAEQTTISFTHQNLMPGWEAVLDPISMTLPADQEGQVSLTVLPPVGVPLGSGEVIVDVEGYVGGELIGGFRKLDTPPLPLHRRQDPFFAESEIKVWPYPPYPGEPSQICVELLNVSDQPQVAAVQFNWANFGIGMPFHPIGGPVEIEVPPHGREEVCIGWVPPEPGHFCIQVELDILGNIMYHRQFSQLNLDVDEPLRPGVPHTIQFPVGNFFNEFTNPDPTTTDIWLEPDVHLPGWEVVLDPMVLPGIPQNGFRMVVMTVTPSLEPLPPDGTPVVDVKAFVDSGMGPQVIGGFRKLFNPPIRLNPYGDPFYAEREITVHPFPPNVGEPSEVCVELRNPTDMPQDVTVHFSWAAFGIGIPFTPINGPRPVHLPPHSIVNECVHWIPEVPGHVCLQVELEIEGYPPQRSQLNLDVDEPLIPGVPHTLMFPVGNPFEEPMTITLGLVPLVDGWEFALSPHLLPSVESHTTRMVSLTVLPPPGAVIPPDQPMPPNGLPVVDVEAYVGDELIGGFRKIARPPIVLHPFDDPPYAEREISVHPETLLAGEPSEVCVELRNPTSVPQEVLVQFSWANFGIGLPFQPINGLRHVVLPPHSIVNECVHWVPPVSGHVCLEVELFVDGYPSQRSQRNVDIDEPLEPGVSHSRFFRVGNPFEEPMTITLGLIPHMDGWDPILSEDVLTNVLPGPEGVRIVGLTVTPPRNEPLPEDGTPILDVEAFMEGELIGGFRKVFSPPGAPHRPQDPIYAESEIFVHPMPPRPFEPTELAVEVRNPTDEPQTLTVTFSVAPFGIGLPFEPVNEPLIVWVPPGAMVVPGTVWVPPEGGLWCIQVEIEIPGHDEPFWSRLNLDLGEPLEPNVPHSRPFPVGNPFTEPVTITLGLIPHFPDWGLELSEDVLVNVLPGPEGVRVVELTVTPPNDLPADGDPIVDVEAFVDGELIGGFRKIFHPPVPVHRPKDPIYAESEIGVDPYPILGDQPVELSVEVFNPTDDDHTVTATFSVAPFGIGLPFSTSHIMPNPVLIFVPAHGAARGHVIWTPPPGMHGKFCVMVELELPGHEKIWSQRNVDVGEPLEPGQPHSMTFWVGRGAYTQPVTVTLGLINHRDDFETDMTSDSFFDVFYDIEIDSDEPVSVTLIVTPSESAPLGTGEPIVDVEAFVDGELLGGFRKLDIPPVPLHKPHEKNYAETELSIIPDPPQLGQPAQVGAEMQNNGAVTSTITLEFGYARFGVGIPFTTTGMVPYTRSLELGPMMTDTAWVTWTPVFSGSHCVQVKLINPDGDYEDIVSQRNVWVEERPPCDQERVFTFTLYNDSPFTVTIDLGLITFNVPEDWEVSTDPEGSVDVGPWGELVVEVHVRIPCPGSLLLMYDAQRMYDVQAQAGSVPIIDVEGYVDGDLIGGIEIQFADVPVSYSVYLPLVMRDS